MPLEDAVRFFTRETKVLSCMDITCGTGTDTRRALGGVMNEKGAPLMEDALFDLASLTKMMTAFLLLRLYEQGQLDLDAPVVSYAPAFSQLGGLTVRQTAWFEKALVTPRRIDQAPTKKEALEALFSVSAFENGSRAYSDIHAMVIRYVLEGASGLPYMALLRREILEPLGMRHTFARVPEALLARCVSFNGEHRVERGRYLHRTDVLPGIPHDPKARALTDGKDECPGHAGLFSTAEDLTILCRGLLNRQVLTQGSLWLMARNQVGRPLPGGGYTQYLGCLCYVRHPDQYYSETPSYFSDRAFGWSGFTGHHLAVDPETGGFEFYLGNRVLNRLSVLVPREGETLADYGLAPDGTGSVRWPDGKEIQSSVGYVHLKDEHLHRETERALRDMGWKQVTQNDG